MSIYFKLQPPLRDSWADAHNFPAKLPLPGPDPDLEERKGGGGAVSKKTFFDPSGPQFDLKITGEGASPGSLLHFSARVRHLSEIACYLKILSHECRTLNLTNSQTGLSFPKVDNALHWTNLYPVDNAVGFSNTNQLESNSSDC